MKFLFTFLRKIIYSIMLLLAVIILNFLLLHIAPGDPVDTLVGEMGGATEELIAQLRADYGLDKSVPQQLFTHIVRMAQGNLGESFSYDQPVLQLILERLPATLILVVTALVLAILNRHASGRYCRPETEELLSADLLPSSPWPDMPRRFSGPELCS